MAATQPATAGPPRNSEPMIGAIPTACLGASGKLNWKRGANQGERNPIQHTERVLRRRRTARRTRKVNRDPGFRREHKSRGHQRQGADDHDNCDVKLEGLGHRYLDRPSFLTLRPTPREGNGPSVLEAPKRSPSSQGDHRHARERNEDTHQSVPHRLGLAYQAFADSGATGVPPSRPSCSGEHENRPD